MARPARQLFVIFFLLSSYHVFAYQDSKPTGNNEAAAKAEEHPSIPSGTRMDVRINESLNSGDAQAGDFFHGSLMNPVIVDNISMFPIGSVVTGKVAEVKRSGRLSEPGELRLVLTEVSHNQYSAQLNTETYLIAGESHGKNNASKIGGGAVLGTVIGAVAGGGKGAAIGAGAGTAAGTGAAAATGKREAHLEAETVHTFMTNGTSVVNTNGTVVRRGYEEQPQHVISRTFGPDDATSSIALPRLHDRYPSETFTAHERRVIRTFFSDNAKNLPPGLGRKDDLPDGLEGQLDSNGALPPGMERKLRPLPEVCERMLHHLPDNLERVVLGREVMIINTKNQVLDHFSLDE